jgi:molybdopterin-guanine dinucleotide biosynthesis protein A
VSHSIGSDAARPAAAIIAGGAARRLGGTAKALLLVGGVRIIDRQLTALRGLADPIFVVAGDPTPFAGLGLEVVPDAVPNAGALGGIYTAIVASPRERTIVLASDLPFVTPQLLARFSESDAEVVMPLGVRGYEPLCALYTRACAEPIRQRIERGALHAARLPDGVRADVIGPEDLMAYDPDGLLFVNVNTPHDHERARDLADRKWKKSEDRIMDDSDDR